MNDPTPDAPPEPAPLDFDRAEPASDKAAPAGPGPQRHGVACGLCGQEITTEYWQSLGKILCDTCRAAVEHTHAAAHGGGTFGKALLLGGGAALGCGIGYAVFVGVSQIQFALVTIGMGWAIGRVIHKTTRGFGGLRYQVLAVALTYFASTMGYLPAVLKGFSQLGNHAAQSAGAAGPKAASTPSAPPSPSMAEPAAADPDPAAAPAPAGGKHGFGVSLLIFTAFSGLVMLAAPFLELGEGFSGLLGLLIIFFGMRTAWRVSKGVAVVVTGPHRLAPDAAAGA